MSQCYPVKLSDAYPCQGIDSAGRAVVYDDLLEEGQTVAHWQDGQGNSYGPMHTVVRRADGLWVE